MPTTTTTEAVELTEAEKINAALESIESKPETDQDVMEAFSGIERTCECGAPMVQGAFGFECLHDCDNE